MNFSLPSHEFAFDFDVVGGETGQRYLGNFVFKRPTIGDRAEISKLQARLGGEVALTLEPIQKAENYIRAFLAVTLKESPQWWKDSDYGALLHDVNVIDSLFLTVNEFQKTFEKELAKKLKDKKESSTPKS